MFHRSSRSRKRLSYREISSDEAPSDIDQQYSSRVRRTSKRLQKRSYIEDSSDSESNSDSEAVLEPETHPSLPTRSNPSRSRKRLAPSEPATRQPSNKRKKVDHRSKATRGKTRLTVEGPAPAAINLPWQHLELDILTQIFKYAAYPLYENASRARPSIQWLLGVSLLSRSFREAAISALLHSPPIYPAARAHGLFHLLSQPQESLSLNYRTKVKKLDVEAKHLLLRKDRIDLPKLVKLTPQLSTLYIYHHYDQVGPFLWAQPSVSKKNWSYPLSLFEALDTSKIMLGNFSWNGRFPSTKQVVENMRSLHLRPCLHRVHSLSLMNLAVPDKASVEEQGQYEDLLVDGLAALPELRQLDFEACQVLSNPLLARLTHDLRRLTIVRCGNFTSKGLQTFLYDHGRELVVLTLESNQSMDLAFIPDLGLLENLEHLRIDLQYRDPSSYHDVEPHYDALLPNGQPTWPSSLRSIHLANMRNLDALETDEFLSSLVESAAELKNLRKLSLKFLLSIAWRDRANLRLKYKPLLERVFLRKSNPPRLTTGLHKTLSFHKTHPLSGLPRLLNARRPSSSQSSLSSVASSCATPTNRKSARIARQEQDNLDSDSSHSLSPHIAKANVEMHADQEQLRVQGLCEELSLRIDGGRPADSQFDEDDFLDEEPSGDEDWRL